MAKKPTRGGRVTPKGTQPQTGQKQAPRGAGPVEHRVVNRFDPASNQRGSNAHAPTRAGHHRGNR